jgi:hypothetical protein
MSLYWENPMKIEDKLSEILFESNVGGGWLLLKAPENPSKENFKQLLATKPGEINIIIDRVTDFIKGSVEDKRGKIVEILKVLSRSYVARTFVGYGLKDEYIVYKGFPVREGDANSDMPNPGSELMLEAKDTFLSWTSSPTDAREISTSYDNIKGPPKGGLVVKITTGNDNILIDINAVVEAVRANYESIIEYNNAAASGMAISKKNCEFLAREAKLYTGDYEVVLPSVLNKCIVEAKWVWSGEGDAKKIQWIDKEEDTNEKEENDEEKTSLQKEMVYALTESVEDVKLMNEVWTDMFAKLAGTKRGIMLKYLEGLKDQYQIHLEIMKSASEFLENSEGDQERLAMAEREIARLEELIAETDSTLKHVQSDRNLQINIVGE